MGSDRCRGRKYLVAAVAGLLYGSSKIGEGFGFRIYAFKRVTCIGSGGQGDWRTGIRMLANPGYKGNLREEFHSELVGETLRSAISEDIVFLLGMRSRSKPCHILYNTEHRHIDIGIAEHLYTLSRIGKGYLLGVETTTPRDSYKSSIPAQPANLGVSI